MKPRGRVGEVRALHARAVRLTARGNHPAANVAFRSALRLASASRPTHPLLLAALLNDFGVLCKYTGQLATANRAYRRALKILKSGERPDHAQSIATIYHNLGGVAFARHRYAEGTRYARYGIKIRQVGRPLDRVALAADEAALAAILVESGHTSQALRILLRTLGAFRRKLSPRHPEVGAVLSNLGALHWKMGRPDSARRALRLSASILKKALGENHPRTASARHNLAIVTASVSAKLESHRGSSSPRRVSAQPERPIVHILKSRS
jgi:tetratricopeptide (TPR) repeat protein